MGKVIKGLAMYHNTHQQTSSFHVQLPSPHGRGGQSRAFNNGAGARDKIAPLASVDPSRRQQASKPTLDVHVTNNLDSEKKGNSSAFVSSFMLDAFATGGRSTRPFDNGAITSNSTVNRTSRSYHRQPLESQQQLNPDQDLAIHGQSRSPPLGSVSFKNRELFVAPRNLTSRMEEAPPTHSLVMDGMIMCEGYHPSRPTTGHVESDQGLGYKNLSTQDVTMRIASPRPLSQIPPSPFAFHATSDSAYGQTGSAVSQQHDAGYTVFVTGFPESKTNAVLAKFRELGTIIQSSINRIMPEEVGGTVSGDGMSSSSSPAVVAVLAITYDSDVAWKNALLLDARMLESRWFLSVKESMASAVDYHSSTVSMSSTLRSREKRSSAASFFGPSVQDKFSEEVPSGLGMFAHDQHATALQPVASPVSLAVEMDQGEENDAGAMSSPVKKVNSTWNTLNDLLFGW